ncbi:hypothetical protein BCR39DRAFT_460742 [Naematelia encephala]|uniref:Uncharacterized protein n=1 Tax=Naematelia encephala TaxID=71784 RepID=A0A1Y2BL30_9TREE|nr:hypothetical protein BCR39DRAFT_460742 [Naematelia encephala]
MSAPATHTKIAENPGKMGVTTAASGKELESDIQRKMKLWGVIAAFRDGRMPNNKQIDKALEYAIASSPVDLKQLSPEGRVLIDDTRDIIETARMIVQEKNADELFQNAVWDSYAGDPSRAKQDGVVPVSKEDAKKDANQAAAHLRVLITLFLTNSEARKIVSDLGIIGRDLFATGAAKAADKARPDQNQLNQVDNEAPSKEWIGADGQKHGANETPEMQIKGPGGAEVRYNPKDSPSDAKVTDPNGNSRSAGQAYNEAQQAKEDAKSKAYSAKDQAKGAAQDHAQDLQSSRDPNASYSEQKEQLKGRASEKADSANQNIDQDDAKNQARDKANQLKNKIPEEHRQRAQDAVNSAKDTVKDAFPEERRDQFIYRLKKVVVECQSHKDYNEAMTWLLDAFDQYSSHAKHVTNKGANAAGSLTDDPNVSGATEKFRLLLERFANGKSMDGIFDALDQLYTDAKNDEGLRNWWSRLDDYVHRVLLEPGYILEDEATREGQELRDSGKGYFQDKYRGHWENFADQVQLWTTAMADDPLNKRLGDDVKRLTKDLLFNEEGNLTFKPKLWNDIRHIILPMVIKQVGYVPLPRCEYTDDKIDLVIENLILSGPNLFPNVILIEAHNRFTFSPYSNINKTLDTHHHVFRAGFSQIQADIRDVAFAFRRKSGWPKISDHGLADVIIAGKGISVDVELESVFNRRDSVFKINHVKVELDTLSFSIRDSKHDLLYKFVKSVATGVIKKAITVGMQTAIRTALGHLDDQLTEVRNTAEDAKKSDETTRTQALKDMYARKKDDAKAKAKAADEKTGTFKIITDRDDQLNPDFSHDPKKSMAKRMFKTEDLAASGTDWRSPAFDLFDKQHPAVTGHHHPAAVQGAGSQNVKTSAVAAARGEQTHTGPGITGSNANGTTASQFKSEAQAVKADAQNTRY